MIPSTRNLVKVDAYQTLKNKTIDLNQNTLENLARYTTVWGANFFTDNLYCVYNGDALSSEQTATSNVNFLIVPYDSKLSSISIVLSELSPASPNEFVITVENYTSTTSKSFTIPAGTSSLDVTITDSPTFSALDKMRIQFSGLVVRTEMAVFLTHTINSI